jgi:ubiquinone/menaquinone biosynthesis C-methylase UbiE
MRSERGFPDYATVAELPGQGSSSEQLSMLYTRYAFAASRVQHQRVLEIACGAGMGLGYLAERPNWVVGGDCTESLLREARTTYRGKMPLVRLDAQALPFCAGSADLILLYEAIYYLARPEAFLQECRRVLSNHGLLILSSVNREWADFHPSPFHQRYFSVRELETLFLEQHFKVEIFGAFPHENHSPKDHLVSVIKRLAIKGRLVPSTMRSKQWLKRLVFGKLLTIPSVIADGLVPYQEPVQLPTTDPVTDFKILFAVARPL